MNQLEKNIDQLLNKPLSDYTDEELTNEITRRINNFSLDISRLLIPMVVIGGQYYQWYEEKRQAKEKKDYE